MEFKFEIEKNALELLGRQSESISPRSEKAFYRKKSWKCDSLQKYKAIHCKKGTDEHRRLEAHKKNSLKNWQKKPFGQTFSDTPVLNSKGKGFFFPL